jgi:hypothetical protein
METVSEYVAALGEKQRSIFEKLTESIGKDLPEGKPRLYHGSPVWFIDGNPILGLSIKQGKVELLFWSGQSFREAGLDPVGKFKAAERLYAELGEVDEGKVRKWISESRTIIWDYKNIRRNAGQLARAT